MIHVKKPRKLLKRLRGAAWDFSDRGFKDTNKLYNLNNVGGTFRSVQRLNDRGILTAEGNWAKDDSAASILSITSGTIWLAFVPRNNVKAEQYFMAARAAVTSNRYYITGAGANLTYGWTTNAYRSTGIALTIGKLMVVSLEWDATGCYMYYNGEQVGATVGATGIAPDLFGFNCVVNLASTTQYHGNAEYYAARVLPYQLGPAQQRQWAADIWAPYQTEIYPVYAPTAVGGTTISVLVASLGLAGFAPIVSVSDNVTIDVPAANLLLSGLAPVVITDAHVTVDVPVAGLTLAGFVPVVSVSDNVTIDVPTGSLNLSGIAPTVLTPVTIDVPAANLLLNGLVPSVSADAHVTIDVPLASLSITGFASVVSVTEHQAIDVPVGSLVLSGYVPSSDVTNHITVDIPVGNFTLTGLAPNITAELIITPDNRVFVVTSENRVYEIAAEDRVYIVSTEDRSYRV